MRAFDTKARGNRGRILLAGDISRVFSDVQTLDVATCEVRANILEAIETAAKEDFDSIGVVMGAGSARLVSALKALREVNGGARIVLLPRMSEEYEAVRIMESSVNGVKLAEDYVVCPVSVEEFYRSVSGEREVRVLETADEAQTNKNLLKKIRLLEKLATEDELTGLKNRRYIWEFSRQIIERTQREGGRVTLLVFDIDDFKHYNDEYGHFAGDEILKQAAVLMRRCCRSHDVVGRIGGDEFAVVFWDDPQRKTADSQNERRSSAAEHPTAAIFIAKRFRREFKGTALPMLGPAGKGVLTISGGLASFPRDGSNIDALFREADKVLLEAKRSGKNRIYLVGKPESDISHIS